jgi:outer membrane lipoprotein-sorting protein
MGELGDVLALMHHDGPRYRTLRAEGIEWRHHSLLNEAFLRATPPGATLAFAGRADGAKEPETSSESWRLWEEPPDRLRAEYPVGDDTVSVIFHGQRWWSYSPSMGALTNNGASNSSHGKGPGEILFRPARLLPLLEFTLTGRNEHLGRPAYQLRARPQPLDRHRDRDLHHLGSGADTYELTLDAERGFLLRSEAQRGGRPFRIVELTGVEPDAPLPADTFTPRAPEGDTFALPHRDRTVPLGQVPAQVPFVIFVPDPAPGRLGFVHVADADPRRGDDQHVRLVYLVTQPDGQHGNLWITESAAPKSSHPDDTWHADDDLAIVEDNSMDYLRVKIHLTRDGTHIHLETTALTTDELVTIAHSLVPLPPSPPQLRANPPG